MAKRTVIADSQKMFAEGIQALLSGMAVPSVKVVGIAHTMEELDHMMTMGIDLLLLELAISETQPADCIAALKKQNPSLRIIVLSHYGDQSLVRDAFKQGADGYVLKSHHSFELMQCMEAVVAGKTYLADGLRLSPEHRSTGSQTGNEVKKQMEDRFILRQKLTKREREILTLIVQFKNNKDIAQELFISDQTVIVHRKRIMKKLGVNNTVNLIKFTMDHQLV